MSLLLVVWHDVWNDLFVPDVSILEKIVRPVLVYVFLIVGLRVAGKRELAQLNPFDLIVLLTLSNTVQNAIIGNDNSVSGGVIGATTLLAVNYFVVRFLYNHERLESIIEGKCDELISNGQILHDHLERELITVAELTTAAHRQGFASLEDIDRAVLETGGTISFFSKEPIPEVARHTEVIAGLNRLSADLAELRKALGRGTSPAS
jgi:uncharacterized membrane protein YcaP (DUF421 family)